MHNIKIKYLVFSLALLLGSTSIFAQNKYAESNTTVVKKLLDRDTIYSNKSLKATASDIASFSLLNDVYTLIDFNSLTDNEEMVTVFVTKDSGFPQMDKEEREAFFSENNKANLIEIISYYIIPGRVDEHAILKAIERGNGSANFRTLSGENLRFKKEGETVYLLTGNGSKNALLQTNFRHSKGFFHLTNGLALPKTQK
ncbi:MAG: fasciclin domain-containing protein [Flavobacteriaceae bacterium]